MPLQTSLASKREKPEIRGKAPRKQDKRRLYVLAECDAWRHVLADSLIVIPALLVLCVAFARDPEFRSYRWYTLLTPFLIGLASLDVGLLPAGVPERLSSLVLLMWFEVVAFRLLRLAHRREPASSKLAAS
jgi:hypothetical protein